MVLSRPSPIRAGRSLRGIRRPPVKVRRRPTSTSISRVAARGIKHARSVIFKRRRRTTPRPLPRPSPQVTSHALTARGSWRGVCIYRGRSLEVLKLFQTQRREEIRQLGRAGTRENFGSSFISLFIVDRQWFRWLLIVREVGVIIRPVNRPCLIIGKRNCD
jgi:hypothetical protein